jgi:hypothetical protein
MTVREFLDVVNFEIVDYAQIYEKIWNEDYQDYDTKATDKRVNTKKDLEQYLDYELDYLDYETHWGEYDDSAIYIKMPKPVYKNGQEIECPCCCEKIIVESNNVKCNVCGWTAN